MLKKVIRPVRQSIQPGYQALAKRNLIKHRATFEALAAYDRGEYIVGRGFKSRLEQPSDSENSAADEGCRTDGRA